MIGIDTNILVRYAVQDHPEQTEKAAVILEAATEEDPVFIGAVTLAEFVWVLKRNYRYTRNDIGRVLEKFFSAREIVFEHAEAAMYALQHYGDGSADFPDLFLGRINKQHGCKVTKTFDKKAGATDDFEVV